jgi:gamma-glutamyl:cysteine ligase YbdK (ATP-grasp superfamily)
MANKSATFPLFSVFGVELEYMIVAKNDLNIQSIADEVFYNINNNYDGEYVNGEIAWSNELALHVIEFKNNEPSQSLSSLADLFHQNITRVNKILDNFNAKLLPTGMHPWMDPKRESKLWPHDCSPVYEAYNRIFDCQGHGWTNLQSVHLNLPFANDLEFAKLHTAIRLLLPIIPALSASTPIVEGRKTTILDNRLFFYAKNQQKIPAIVGQIIPEAVTSRQEYEEQVLARIYRDIAKYDQEGILQDEWLNSRGAIPRFCRNTIEIRVIDVQECPLADVAILVFITAILKKIIAETWLDLDAQLQLNTNDLAKIFLATAKNGLRTKVDDVSYLKAFGINKKTDVKNLWQHLLAEIDLEPRFAAVINTILQQGNLAERILKVVNNDFSRANLQRVYNRLSECLRDNQLLITND